MEELLSFFAIDDAVVVYRFESLVTTDDGIACVLRGVYLCVECEAGVAMDGDTVLDIEVSAVCKGVVMGCALLLDFIDEEDVPQADGDGFSRIGDGIGLHEGVVDDHSRCAEWFESLHLRPCMESITAMRFG